MKMFQGLEQNQQTSSIAGQTRPTSAALLALLDRMREGDREAAAEFIRRYGPSIRRRVSGRLGIGMRRLFDSQDVLSTLSRRLDNFVRNRRLLAQHEGELWSLIFRITDNAIADKARIMQKLKNTEGADSPFARRLLGILREHEQGHDENAFSLQLSDVFDLLKSDTDRQVLRMWLTGMSMSAIAKEIGSSPDATRQRWKAIRDHLKDKIRSHDQ